MWKIEEQGEQRDERVNMQMWTCDGQKDENSHVIKNNSCHFMKEIISLLCDNIFDD